MPNRVFAVTLVLFVSACQGGTASLPEPDISEAALDGGLQEVTTSDAAAEGDDAREPGNPFAELEATFAAYAGRALVASETTKESTTNYEFDPETGPLCLRGDPYRFSVRDGTADHDDLIIFLQGGGACWSELCLASEKAGRRIPESAHILDPTMAANPVRDWDLAYLPYCDGSFFAGDADHDDDGDGVIDRYHRGAWNLVAALEVTKARYPNPARIVLAGSSGGGFGTIWATAFVRILYPDAELLVFNDAGLGIAKAEDPSFLAGLIDEFNGWGFVPPSCQDCLGNGHITRATEWELERDPNLKISVFSSYGDAIIATVFLQIGPEAFEAALRAETTRLHERFPARYMPFLVQGTVHTTLLGEGFGGADAFGGIAVFGGLDTTEVDGLTVSEWFQMMLDGDPGWVPVIE